MIRAFRIVAGVVVGYLVMVALLTLVQEVWLGGVSFAESSGPELLLAGAFSFLAAAISGALAAWISAGRVAGATMSALVAVETIYLARTGALDGPFWFDVGAAASLVIGIVLGSLAFVRCRPRIAGDARHAMHRGRPRREK